MESCPCYKHLIWSGSCLCLPTPLGFWGWGCLLLLFWPNYLATLSGRLICCPHQLKMRKQLTESYPDPTQDVYLRGRERVRERERKRALSRNQCRMRRGSRKSFNSLQQPSVLLLLICVHICVCVCVRVFLLSECISASVYTNCGRLMVGSSGRNAFTREHVLLAGIEGPHMVVISSWRHSCYMSHINTASSGAGYQNI